MTGKKLEGSSRVTERRKTTEVSLCSPFSRFCSANQSPYMCHQRTFWPTYVVTEESRNDTPSMSRTRVNFWDECEHLICVWWPTPPGLNEVPSGHNVLTLTFHFFCLLSFSELQPDELEAVHSHTFRVKTFKKAKHCSVCKQIIIQDGLICRGQSLFLKL